MILGFFMSILGASFFMFSLLYSGSFALTMVCAAFFGFWIMAMLPVGIDAAVEVTYPCPEGVVSGLIFQVGNMFGVFLLFVMEVLRPNPAYGDQIPYWSFYTMFIIAAFAAALIPIFKGPYKRVEFEKTRKDAGDLRFADKEVNLDAADIASDVAPDF
jgi:hypothetical protein